ncbi:MAG: hypothetical protein EAZ27_00555 [Cytophagales bacterium]|nr:MAG: hypothetical protein EAZ27_00555 [Cytophagales bacterium]
MKKIIFKCKIQNDFLSSFLNILFLLFLLFFGTLSIIKNLLFFEISFVIVLIYRFLYVLSPILEIYEDLSFRIYISLFGLKYGKTEKLPPLGFIYIYRKNFSGKTSNSRLHLNFKNRSGADLVLKLFDSKDREIFAIYGENEEFITETALKLSSILVLNVHDYRGREMEIYSSK